MYTTCPACHSVFRLTPRELSIAGGMVRCGECAATFNALDALSDQPPGEHKPEHDEILPLEETLPPERPGMAPTTDDTPAQAVPAHGEQAPDGSLEFDVPEDRWSTFFERTRLPGPRIERETISAGNDDAGWQESGPDETGDAGEWTELLRDLPDGTGTEAADPAIDDDASSEEEDSPIYVIAPEDRDDSDEPAMPTGAPQLQPEREIDALPDSFATMRREPYLASGDPAPGEPTAPGEESPGAPPWLRQAPRPIRRRRWAWLLGGLLLALVLAAQLVHHNRDALAAHPGWGEPLLRFYGELGLTLYPAWQPTDYEIVGAEAIAGRTTPEALEIVARLRIDSESPVGLPLVRVLVQDRWGNVVGQRLFEPGEYTDRVLAGRLLPGTVVPIEISVLDPGLDAHGFEVDVCVRRRQGIIECRDTGSPFDN